MNVNQITTSCSEYCKPSSWFESCLQKWSWMKVLEKMENEGLNSRVGRRFMAIMRKFSLLAFVQRPDITNLFPKCSKCHHWWFWNACTVSVRLCPVQKSSNVFFVALGENAMSINSALQANFKTLVFYRIWFTRSFIPTPPPAQTRLNKANLTFTRLLPDTSSPRVRKSSSL